jgi:signal transduction histidine kinase
VRAPRIGVVLSVAVEGTTLRYLLGFLVWIVFVSISRDKSDLEGSAAGRTPRRSARGDANRAMVISAIADGIVVVDERGINLLCNPAAEEILGRTADELVGTPFGFPITVGEPTEIDLALPDGRRRVVEVRATNTTLQGASVYVAGLRDITPRRQLERELHDALDHQSTVVAVAAHQLDNPLSAISLLVHLLRDRRASLTEEETAEMLDRIADRTAHLQGLMRKFLTASRIEGKGIGAGSEPVRVLEFILQRLADFNERSHDVELSCDPELAVLVDPTEFSEMLGNYLDNALTHGRPPIEVQVTTQGSFIEIRVCDHGPGVPEEFASQLFERFSREPRARQDTEGTGLGLWIVRKLAQAHEGDAWYEPRDNGGSCFCLRLHATPNDSA